MDDVLRRDMSKRIDKVFRGRYELLGELGSGGMGMVFLIAPRDDSSVRYAIKPVDRKSPENRGFKVYEELRILKDLDHPNIVKVYETGRDRDYVYMVQEYIDGRSLADLRDDPGARAGLKDEDIWRWMSEIADALRYMHSKGVVHRDVKPGNIMIDGSGRAVLIDFGIARRISALRRSFTGVTTGSAPYSPLERLEGKPDGIATDIYAYGASFYSLLNGSIPQVSGREINALRTDGREIRQYYMDAYRAMLEDIEKIENGEVRSLIRNCIDMDPGKRLQGFRII